jgi:hypothetical protein
VSNWHVVVVTENGTVSILKNLTEFAAKEAAERLLPSGRRGPRRPLPNTVQRVEILGPDET